MHYLWPILNSPLFVPKTLKTSNKKESFSLSLLSTNQNFKRFIKDTLKKYNDPQEVQRVGLLVQKAEDRLHDIIRRQNEHTQKLMETEQMTQELMDGAKELKKESLSVWSAAYWLNKKYQILIFGGVLLLLIIILIFIFK
jgi:hypothetical protein